MRSKYWPCVSPMLRDERARGNHNAHVDGLALLDLDVDEASVRQEHLVAAECDEPDVATRNQLRGMVRPDEVKMPAQAARCRARKTLHNFE